MSSSLLINTCLACGAEESLDGLLARMIDDDQVRRLVADVITQSLPLGGQVVSYLRLHKPARQRLRMSKVRDLLAELVPDIKRGAITRKGRDWQAPGPAWQAAFAATFEARDKGQLALPLEGNAYLYEVLLRQADRAEAAVERSQTEQTRSRAHVGTVQSAAGLLSGLTTAAPAPVPAREPLALPLPPLGPSSYALKVQAEIKAKLDRRHAAADAGITTPAASSGGQP